MPDLSTPRGFEQAYDLHAGGVYAAAHRVLRDHAQAQDVVQDVFLRLWRRPGAFDARRAGLGTYLRLMARSRAIDLVREQQAAGRMIDRVKDWEQTTPLRPRAEGPADIVERDDERAAIRSALARLPRAQAEALVQAYWGGLTAEEIARKHDIPVGTAKSRLRLGLARLRRDPDALALA